MGNPVTRAEMAKMVNSRPQKKVVLSRSKLRAGNTEELAKFHYLVNPVSFKKLAELQGVLVENLTDVVNLARAVEAGKMSFNFGRLYRTMKHKASDITRAEASKMIIK